MLIVTVHSDHYAGDSQFADQPKTQVVKPDSQSVIAFFNFKDWPNTTSNLNLGERNLVVMPIPGHQRDSIAIYDSETHFVLTGDSFYPGRLYIRDWSLFADSIERLTKLTKTSRINGFLGTHIEMAKNGTDFPVGSTYQPDEVDLYLGVSELTKLNNMIKQLGDSATKAQVGDVILYPVE